MPADSDLNKPAAAYVDSNARSQSAASHQPTSATNTGLPLPAAIAESRQPAPAAASRPSLFTNLARNRHRRAGVRPADPRPSTSPLAGGEVGSDDDSQGCTLPAPARRRKRRSESKEDFELCGPQAASACGNPAGGDFCGQAGDRFQSAEPHEPHSNDSPARPAQASRVERVRSAAQHDAAGQSTTTAATETRCQAESGRESSGVAPAAACGAAEADSSGCGGQAQASRAQEGVHTSSSQGDADRPAAHESPGLVSARHAGLRDAYGAVSGAAATASSTGEETRRDQTGRR